MSLQGHADAVTRHLRKASQAITESDRQREVHFAGIAYRNLCKECELLSEKQVQRDSPDAYAMWKRGVPGL